MTPIATKVFIVETAPVEITQNGIVLPMGNRELTTKGKVAFTGPDCKQVKPGDTVLYPTNTPNRFKENDTVYVVLYEESIVAIV